MPNYFFHSVFSKHDVEQQRWTDYIFRDGVDTFTCDCLSGYEGETCHHNIDECHSDPCIHGKCVDGINEYACRCEEGYDGVSCERNIDECVSSPCLNGGKSFIQEIRCILITMYSYK